MTSFSKLESEIIQCGKCPRLRRYGKAVAETKKKEFLQWDYWGKPVPGFGDPNAKLWIVGLAPAAHGANRTGRMFTGDSSGNWLYRALFEAGFASQPESTSKDDGLQLRGTFISAAGRCAPPDNKPTPAELANCACYLDTEFQLLRHKKLILALGSIAFDAVTRLLARQNRPIRPRLRFSHGIIHRMASLTILCSYHPSRQNTNTGRLTQPMWNSIFATAKEIVGN